MKRLATAVCLLGLLAALPATADEPEVDQAAAMAAWEKAMTPGAFHAFFAKKAGTWQVTGKMWMAPDAEPMPSESVGKAEMILGGRYLKEEMQGTSMGMPFEGLSILGYDNITGDVTVVWYDNMGTMTTIMSGPYDEPGAPLELAGTMTDPITGRESALRTVTTFISDDESLFEYYGSMMAGMPEFKVMELHYSRVE
jgi:hypothetical protein